MEEEKNLDYWKKNAEEDYMQVPISVLRYITELENRVEALSQHDVMGSNSQSSIKAKVVNIETNYGDINL